MGYLAHQPTHLAMEAKMETRLSFSTLFGSPTMDATEAEQPFTTDDEARRARDIEAAALKAFGYKVRKSTLRAQHRPYWDWAVECGRSCTVYELEILN
jgi:hypothetical protein